VAGRLSNGRLGEEFGADLGMVKVEVRDPQVCVLRSSYPVLKMGP
jgi:hypothetical protein